MSDESPISTMSMLAYHRELTSPPRQALHHRENERTIIGIVDPFYFRQLELSTTPHEEFFFEHYARLRPVLEASSTAIPHYAVFAFDAQERRMIHRLLPLEPGRPTDLILGRHERADLRLRSDKNCALRHLLLRATFEDKTPMLRVMDLHSQQGFHVWNQHIQKTSYSASHAHLFGMVGHTHFMAILNKRLEWPKSPAEAWDILNREGFRCDATHPALQTPSDEIMGTLVLDDEELVFTKQELHAGILLGRYDRCHVKGNFAQEDNVSRVHALLWWDPTDHALWLIDTASTNHTELVHDGNRVPLERSHCLEKEQQFFLANESLRWLPAPRQETDSSYLN